MYFLPRKSYSWKRVFSTGFMSILFSWLHFVTNYPILIFTGVQYFRTPNNMDMKSQQSLDK